MGFELVSFRCFFFIYLFISCQCYNLRVSLWMWFLICTSVRSYLKSLLFSFCLQSMQILEEEKSKLDAFCEQGLKNVRTYTLTISTQTLTLSTYTLTVNETVDMSDSTQYWPTFLFLMLKSVRSVRILFINTSVSISWTKPKQHISLFQKSAILYKPNVQNNYVNCS